MQRAKISHYRIALSDCASSSCCRHFLLGDNSNGSPTERVDLECQMNSGPEIHHNSFLEALRIRSEGGMRVEDEELLQWPRSIFSRFAKNFSQIMP